MSKFKKIISITTSITTIAMVSGIAMLAPMAVSAVSGVNEGDMIKVANNPDIYIAKYVGSKAFKRLILSPSVFNSYGHLKWSNVKTVDQATLDAFTVSTLVRAVGDPKVYNLAPIPNSDNGGKHWVNMTAEQFTGCKTTNTLFDWDSVYQINTVDRDSYTVAADDTTCVLSTEGGGLPGPVGALTVALAPDTPPAGVAVANAARVPFTKVNFTASSAGSVIITGITAQRGALAVDAAIGSVVLIDADTNLQIGLSQTLDANHQAKFTTSITIPAGTTKGIIIGANMPAVTTIYAGQVATLSLVAVTTTSSIGGALPITGNYQTINGTLAIGSATLATGGLDPGAAANKPVGTTGYTFSSVKVTGGTTEDVTVTSINWNQSGSAASSDLANIKVSVGGTDYATTVSTDGKYYTVSFGTGILIAKGLSAEFSVKGDMVGGSGRTISFDLYRATDMVIRGNTYGYYLTPTYTVGGLWAATNPIFNGNDVQVGNGTLRVDKNSVIAPASNISSGATGAILGGFDFVVQGESINVTSMIVDFNTVGGVGSTSDITNITLAKPDGTVLAGPVNGANVGGSGTAGAPGTGTATFSGTVTFPIGTTQVLVKGNLAITYGVNSTIMTGFGSTASGKTAVDRIPSNTGVTTGNAIVVTPASAVSGNTMSVRTGAVTITVLGTPVGQPVIAGVQGFVFANYLFDASNSGEDMRVNTITIQQIVGAAAQATDVFSMQLMDGTAALNTGSNIKDPVVTVGVTNPEAFTLDNPLIIPKGTQKTVALKGNIKGNATANDTQQWGIGAVTVTVTGVTSGQSYTATVTPANGSTMVIAAAGGYSVFLDASTPTGKLIAANTTGNTMTALRMKATSEDIYINRMRLDLSNASSTGIDVAKVYVYDGATLVGQGILQGAGGAAYVVITILTDSNGQPLLKLSAGVDKIVTVKADINSITPDNTIATAGHIITINYDGTTDQTMNQGKGASSGTSIANGYPTTNQAGAFIFRSVPTVSKLTVGNLKLGNGTMALYKFRVAADAKGDIALDTVTFQIATTVASVTNLNLYDVTATPEALQNTTTTFSASTDFSLNMRPSGVETPLTISATAYKDFELRGTISGANTGASVTTALQGDAAAPAALNGGLLPALTVQGDANNDFIWSDFSKGGHSLLTSDWFNGFLVSGLPSSALTQETISY